ncbi:hypothetical protein FDI40_gp493 [Agrobacterium phage Atu_ph07]|uniref:Uncharacterized protein n=1 Tax=Agrobacterium phage Atu_ph07 TaxID=2024264 RepID=A0A2L0V0A5_9CAUD|nr:hypothetical protein FDI40_gp493 [Agrobacterium phage Atu_ph07]AUZ95252.1 hypothetical protein [Agrobacterium phage Atu_ph07]
MSNNAAALKRAASTSVSDITNVKRATSRTEKEKPSIANNPFFQVMSSTSLTPEEKVQQVAKAMSEIRTKEENRERVRQLEEFSEYQQVLRKEMASEIIALTNTDTFAQLQQVYDRMNTGLLDFNDAMEPILEIIDAMHVVRKEGKTAELFEEIRSDRREEDEHKNMLAEMDESIRKSRAEINMLFADIAELREQRSFFGFGGVKAEAIRKIAELESKIELLNQSANEMQTKRQTFAAEWSAKTHENEEYENAKRIVRNMLDLSAEQHRENQKKSVLKAQEFIEISDESLSSVRSNLLDMNGQIERLLDANTSITSTMAIMGEGLKVAETEIQKKRAEVDSIEAGDSMVKKMQKDNSLRDIDEHATLVSATVADTALSFADLGSQTVRITTMKDANVSQLDKVRKMHTQGVAGVADRLSVALTAVGQAAIGESAAIAKDTLGLMTDATNNIAHKEAMRVALGANEINDDILKAIGDLEEYGEILRNTTDIRREAVKEMRSNLDQIGDIAKSLQADINDAKAVHSDPSMAPAKDNKNTNTNAFGF